MKQDLWQHLPAELVIDILSRLPVGSIIRFKCVCKSWLDLFESREFCRSHLRNSKSIPGLALIENWSELCHLYQFVDEHEHEQDRPLSPERHLSIALKLSLPAHLNYKYILDCSVNGLLLLCMWPNNYFICNPLTGEYIELPSNPHYASVQGIGFGVSKMSNEYKIVRVSSGKCEVYTLGMGSWRSVAPVTYHDNHKTIATFLNGNLHWLIHDHADASSYAATTVVGISCFDLESELFTIFPPPPAINAYGFYSCICTLEQRLAFSHNAGGSVVIWLMNEYGDHKSWTRKYFITIQSRVSNFDREDVIPIKVLRGGDIMVAQLRFSRCLCYFNRTNNTVELLSMPSVCRTIVSYTPSILSLKTFSADN